MLVSNSHLIGTPVLSMQSAGPIGTVSAPIVDPDNLKIIAFYLTGPFIKGNTNIIDVKSIREYSKYGMVIDSIEELIEKDDVVKIGKIIDLNFGLIDLKVITKKGSKLGKISDFTVTDNDFMIQQLIVKRPLVKAFIDPELTIPRKEIVEVTDYQIVVKDEEKTIKKKAASEDFIPNFVNPFRKTEQDFAPAKTKETED